MFSRTSKGLVLALSLAATTFAVGCAGEARDEVAVDEGAATASSLRNDYEGTIGNLKVLVRLEAQGAEVSGSYFYADKVGNGDTLVLRGKTSGAKITLTESVNGAGPTTGTFEGTISSSAITGSWKAGNTTLPLKLSAITSLKTATRKVKATAPKSAEEYARECSLEAEIIEVYGVDAGLEKQISAALHVDPLDKAADGTCSSDIRWVTQSIHYNGNGFLTVHVATEWSGGAHPENGSEYFNFSLTAKKALNGADIFAAGSEMKVRDLVEKQIQAQADMTAEEKEEQITEFREHFTSETKLEHLVAGVGEKGITIDMGNSYPHVILALAPVVEIPWADAKPVLNRASGLDAIAR